METTAKTKPPDNFFCKRCHAIISERENNEAIKKNWLPLCQKCEPEMRNKFEEWYPKFRELRQL